MNLKLSLSEKLLVFLNLFRSERLCLHIFKIFIQNLYDINFLNAFRLRAPDKSIMILKILFLRFSLRNARGRDLTLTVISESLIFRFYCYVLLTEKMRCSLKVCKLRKIVVKMFQTSLNFSSIYSFISVNVKIYIFICKMVELSQSTKFSFRETSARL